MYNNGKWVECFTHYVDDKTKTIHDKLNVRFIKII